MRSPLLLLVLTPSLFAQPLSFGVKVGAPLTQAFDIAANPFMQANAETRRYTLGPTVELHLPAGLGIELDALYKRFSFALPLTTSASQAKTDANSWEFPLLLKYRFKGGLVRPYLDAGVAFGTLTGLTQLQDFFRKNAQTPAFESGRRTGFVLGGGLEIRVPILRISPEIRWTRWGWDNFRNVGSVLRSNDDQAEVLVGITF